MNIQWFFDCLENDIPFGFARFNDGEMILINNPNGIASRGAQRGTKELSDTLIDCIKHRQKNYFVGVPCSLCYPAMRKKADDMVGDYEHKVLAVSNINRNYIEFCNRLFRYLKGKTVWWISGSDQNIGFLQRNGIKINSHIIAPSEDAWRNIDNLRKHSDLFKDGDIVFISLGPTGRVLVKEYFEKQPKATFIDIGSCFDPFTRNVMHKYHQCREGKNLLEPCNECN